MGFLNDIDNLQQQAAGTVAPPPDPGLTRTGRLGTATIDAVRETSVAIELDLTVTVDGGAPYAVTHRQAVAPTAVRTLRPGVTVPVRVDPTDRSSLTIG
jgi:hypothetical protein